MDMITIGIYLLLGALITGYLSTTFYIVRGKHAAILETFGKPHETATMPGLRFKAPWPITTVVGFKNLQIQEISENVSVKTDDNSFMHLPVKVQYRASDNPQGPVKAFYELENPEAQISTYILNSIRQTAAGMTMDELYSGRSQMEDAVQSTLTEKFEGFGYVIVNVLVDEPQPSDEVRDAFNRVIASKREMEAAENLAAAKRIELVGIAEAEAESKKLQGNGIAEMRDAIVKGLKESVEKMTAAGLETGEALQLIMDTNRQDTLTTAAAKGNLVILDLSKGSEMMGQFVASGKAASVTTDKQTTTQGAESVAKITSPNEEAVTHAN